MTYRCLKCRKDIPPEEINNRGAHRKYCKSCARKVQKAQDLNNKKRKREEKKAIRLIKELSKNPLVLPKLEESIEKIGRLQQESRQTRIPSFPLTLKPIASMKTPHFDDTPQQWSEKELAKFILDVLMNSPKINEESFK